MSGAGEATATRPPRVRVLVTVFNRKALTLACLERLEAQARQVAADVRVVLVDDGSRDGTADAVRARFPAVEVVAGSGDLYWNGGMRRALEVARREDPEFYLLLNDDTHLLPGALERLLATHRELEARDEVACIVVGSTRDPATGALTYGGWSRGPWHAPGRLERVPPGDEPRRCDTLNGNVVLVPRDALERVGGLDPVFTHSMGDLDLGLRATRAGCSLWVAPGWVGECVENVGRGMWVDRSLEPRERWKRLLGPKGLPPREWLTFTARHYGPFWPLHFAWPYVKVGWAALRRRSPAP
jgi:GT2 family glycosyltransferase